MSVQIIIGDCRDILDTLPDASVQCVVTSPPYYGLRDYGEDDQIGLEETPEEYIAELVDVFRRVRRVLRDDGVLFLNLGDSYATQGGSHAGRADQRGVGAARVLDAGAGDSGNRVAPAGLKPKDLIGIPWRVALALQADGWWLRSDIIWHKPNPMPESVTDRPTKAHEYVFLLSKSARYFYDAEAVREENADPGRLDYTSGPGTNHNHYVNEKRKSVHVYLNGYKPGSGRNRRSVWTIATKPFSGAHFAVMPPDLVEPCIKAGTSERGACPECGAPWERVIVKVGKSLSVDERHGRQAHNGNRPQQSGYFWTGPVTAVTDDWQPTCDCDAGDPVPCAVLDPFGGAGTTGLVADRLRRDAILIELSADYAEMARRRIVNDAPMFARVEVK